MRARRVTLARTYPGGQFCPCQLNEAAWRNASLRGVARDGAWRSMLGERSPCARSANTCALRLGRRSLQRPARGCKPVAVGPCVVVPLQHRAEARARSGAAELRSEFRYSRPRHSRQHGLRHRRAGSRLDGWTLVRAHRLRLRAHGVHREVYGVSGAGVHPMACHLLQELLPGGDSPCPGGRSTDVRHQTRSSNGRESRGNRRGHATSTHDAARCSTAHDRVRAWNRTGRQSIDVRSGPGHTSPTKPGSVTRARGASFGLTRGRRGSPRAGRAGLPSLRVFRHQSPTRAGSDGGSRRARW